MIPTARLIALTQPVEEAADLGIHTPLDLIEFAGRWDYGETSVAKMTEGNEIIGRWLDAGEESMVEMVHATFFITCSRVVSHELVRHRIASYQQESQRFVSYKGADTDDLFYVPEGNEATSKAAFLFRGAYESMALLYEQLLGMGVPKQLARYVLPNATRTRIIATMNLRQWRHVNLLRMHPSAQPEMQIIAKQVYAALDARFPIVFNDIPERIAKGREAR